MSKMSPLSTIHAIKKNVPFFFGTNNPQRMLQQASHHVISNLSRREGCVWGKVVPSVTIVKWSQDILFSHCFFFHHGVTWTSNISQLLMHFVDLWSIHKVDMVCLWASLAIRNRQKNGRNSSHQTATFGPKKWGHADAPLTVPRFFLEPWDFLAGIKWQSTNVSGVFSGGGGGFKSHKHEVSFQPDHKLVVGPIYGSPYHQSTKNEQNSMITNPLNLPVSQSYLASAW